jgi:hypothetical protein
MCEPMGRREIFSHFFAIGWNRRALYKWVCKLCLYKTEGWF